ncbi:unnamed protein product, partial [Polarella glacialis]
VQPRDLSPTRVRSFMMQAQGVLPKSASPPPPLHSLQLRSLVPYSIGPSLPMPAFPPPVQVPGIGVPIDAHMIASPRPTRGTSEVLRKDQRASTD